MKTIFLAYAHQPDAPLSTLQKEDDAVYEAFSRRVKRKHFDIHRDSHTTREKIIHYLNLHKDDLVVFHYSGHAGRDVLLLEENSANAQGIAGLLDQCPNLRLVVLNGCSTLGQVDRLLELSSMPVVIATSAPVEDESATQFAITFYQSLVDQYSNLEEAFEVAVAAAQTATPRKLTSVRGIKSDLAGQGEAADPVWGIFYSSEYDLEWKLPVADETPAEEPEPNLLLVEGLLTALAPFDRQVQQIVEAEGEESPYDMVDKKAAVLRLLPYPVSEQLRKLIALRTEEKEAIDGQIFFDQRGLDRLRQIAVTYSTAMELLTCAMLAQLWDVCNERDHIVFSPEEKGELRSFLQMPRKERTAYPYRRLIGAIFRIIEANGVVPFFEELSGRSDIFTPDSDFARACAGLEAVKQDVAGGNSPMSEGEAAARCPEAEAQLLEVLARLSFLANYTLESVKSIGVQYFRHSKKPSYTHRIVRIIQRFLDFSEMDKEMEAYVATASVYFKRKGTADRQLNLSPFVIDENAFNPKATLAKLRYFNGYEKKANAYFFQHSYKPRDPLLQIREPYEGGRAPFKVIEEQFDAFAQLIFQKPMAGI
jgi:hypothetical protein